MKLHLSNPDGINTITGYGPGFVLVNGGRHERSLVVLPDRLLPDWEVQRSEQLTAETLARLLELAPEVVLLGTGPTLRFPDFEALRALRAHGVGVEVMDSAAACRTYNILAAEGRRVAAALIVG